MERTRRVWTGVLMIGLLAAGAARAQQQDRYEQDQYDEESANRFALALGAGLADAAPGAAPYFSAALRVRLGDEGAAEGISAFIEPEVGYWEDDEKNGAVRTQQSDLLVGVNIVGAFEMSRVEYFIGAGIGVHFLGADVDLANVSTSEDADALGVNVHFGVDIDLSDNLALFGVGRFDIIDDNRDESVVVTEDVQGKGYVGLRFSF